MRTVRSIIMLGAALALPAAAAAQSTPAGTAQAFFDAMHAQRWREAAELVDPASLARYHEHELSRVVWGHALAGGERHYEVGVDTLPEVSTGDREIPPFLPETLDLAAYDTVRLEMFPGLGTVRELRTLPSAEFLGRALEQAARLLDIPDELDDGTPLAPAVVIGTLMMGDTAAYVLYAPEDLLQSPDRRRVPHEEPAPHVLPLDLREGRWWVRLTSQNAPVISGLYMVADIGITTTTVAEPAP